MHAIRPLRTLVLPAMALIPALCLGACGPDPEKAELRRKLADAEARAAAAERRAGATPAQPAPPVPQAGGDTTPFGQPMDDTRPIDTQPVGNDPVGAPAAAPVAKTSQNDQHFNITP